MENFKKLGLDKKVISGLSNSSRARASLEAVIELTGLSPDDVGRSKGILLYDVAMHYKTEEMAAYYSHRDILARYIGEGLIEKRNQLDEAYKYLKEVHLNETIDEAEFKARSGVGVIIADEEIHREVKAFIAAHKDELVRDRYLFEIKLILRELNAGPLKWAHGKKVKDVVDAELLELLGPKTEKDLELGKKKRKKVEPKAAKANIKAEEDNFDDGKEHLGPPLPSPRENTQNSVGRLAEHLNRTGGKVITRFPPEPNGYLHIGHAKAMAMDFGVARRMDGSCILRYDDTNPSAEKTEYIENIEENVAWLGYKPLKITYSSDYFGELYNFAMQLIEEGKAYVCHQTAAEIAHGRENRIESPWRNRPREESLKLFEDMKNGKFGEGEATLRCKIDMQSDNPCMRDFVAYRVKYVSHPRTGDEWCVYPSYDYTHCIIDSLEDITHSLCTLEFRVRRESYMWLLDALHLYKPVVFEFSRLNLTHNIMSKRKLQTLVNTGIVSGWDDPRLPTINGLRRRGYTSSAINKFVTLAGVSLTENIISHKLLEYCIRKDLDEVSPRRMGVINPLKVTITNLTEPIVCDAPNHPKKPEFGSRKISCFKNVWIEKEDFKESANKSFYGLTAKQPVSLKYTKKCLVLDEVLKDAEGEVTELKCKLTETQKTKGHIHWVSADTGSPLEVEYRLYDHLFKSKDPLQAREWTDDVDRNSLVIKKGFGEDSFLEAAGKPYSNYQLERVGYFVMDPDSVAVGEKGGNGGRVVLNLIVSLKDAKKQENQ